MEPHFQRPFRIDCGTDGQLGEAAAGLGPVFSAQINPAGCFFVAR